VKQQNDKKMQADLAVAGMIQRFLQRGTFKEIPGGPASFVFSVYLIEVAGGKRLWRNAFYGT
jgi:hypothetical protein